MSGCTMSATAKVTSKGQITLPATFRAEHDIQTGDEIVFINDLAGRPTVKVRKWRRLAFNPEIRPDLAPLDVDAATADGVLADFDRAERSRS